MPETKLHDLQNRLGFVVELARHVAEQKEQRATGDALAAVERRPPQAQHWNLLTGLVADQLSYAA